MAKFFLRQDCKSTLFSKRFNKTNCLDPFPAISSTKVQKSTVQRGQGMATLQEFEFNENSPCYHLRTFSLIFCANIVQCCQLYILTYCNTFMGQFMFLSLPIWNSKRNFSMPFLIFHKNFVILPFWLKCSTSKFLASKICQNVYYFGGIFEERSLPYADILHGKQGLTNKNLWFAYKTSYTIQPWEWIATKENCISIVWPKLSCLIIKDDRLRLEENIPWTTPNTFLLSPLDCNNAFEIPYLALRNAAWACSLEIKLHCSHKSTFRSLLPSLSIYRFLATKISVSNL